MLPPVEGPCSIVLDASRKLKIGEIGDLPWPDECCAPAVFDFQVLPTVSYPKL